jgi:hypothetical protein
MSGPSTTLKAFKETDMMATVRSLVSLFSEFVNPVLALLGQGLKNRQFGKNWILLIIPIYAKVSKY